MLEGVSMQGGEGEGGGAARGGEGADSGRFYMHLYMYAYYVGGLGVVV